MSRLSLARVQDYPETSKTSPPKSSCTHSKVLRAGDTRCIAFGRCGQSPYNPRVRLFCIVLVLGLASVAVAATPTAVLRNGKWVNVAGNASPSHPQPDTVLDRVQALVSAGHVSAARDLDVRWIHSHSKRAEGRDQAVFLMARIEFAADNRIKAFYYDDEVMDEYPSSRFFYPALRQQYRIASDYLNGRKDTFLGFRVVSREDEAIEMMYRIQQRSPGSPLAEKALLRTADYYYQDGDYDLASDAYTAYANDYPRSPRVPEAELRVAFSSLAQFRGTAFDATPLLNAQGKLQDIEAAYPDLAADEDVAALLKAIRQTLAAKLLLTADFYARTRVPVGAVHMYRYVIAAYPQSPQATKAKNALKKMPAFALKQPSPNVGDEFGSTVPTVIDANHPHGEPR